jgi:hypothetical protein
MIALKKRADLFELHNFTLSCRAHCAGQNPSNDPGGCGG